MNSAEIIKDLSKTLQDCWITTPISEQLLAQADTLKTKLTHAPLLGFADYNKPFIVETDASHVELGAVLS